MDSNNSLSEEQLEQKTTYKNYIRGIGLMCEMKNSTYKILNYNLSNENLLKGCLGGYYYEKYITEIYNHLNTFEKITTQFFKDNNIINADKKAFLFEKKKAEKRVIELYKKLPNKLEKVKPGLKDFFVKNTSDDVINKLKKEFNGFRNKKMAILIYLLNKNELIRIDNNDKKAKSRIHFVRVLTGEKLKSIQGINNHLTSITGELKSINANDTLYIEIKEQLEKIVSNC